MAIIGDLLCLHVLCDYILLSKISVRELLQYYNDRSYVQNTEDSVLKQDLDMLVLHCGLRIHRFFTVSLITWSLITPSI